MFFGGLSSTKNQPTPNYRNETLIKSDGLQ